MRKWPIKDNIKRENDNIYSIISVKFCRKPLFESGGAVFIMNSKNDRFEEN